MEQKEIETNQTQFILKCPVVGCSKEIRGDSKSRNIYNLDTHMRQKHPGVQNE